MAESIKNVNESYESIKSSRGLKHVVSEKNMRRVIQVRSILKNKLFDHNLAIRDMHKLKEDNLVSDLKTIKALHSLGPPSFVKTRFNSKTVAKFKILSGKTFGK